MIYLFLFCSLFLCFTGCFSSRLIDWDDEVVQGGSLTKQKQRVIFLQKKLELAEREVKKAEAQVEQLERDLHASQLSLIRKQLEIYEKSQGSLIRKEVLEEEVPFLKEREMLQRMMEEGPSPQSFEAELVLDRILRTITESRDLQNL